MTPIVEEAPSPNFGPRRLGAQPEMVVLHYTGMETAKAALARLQDPRAEVSAHYLVSEDGRVWRLVPEEMRAWHAGAGSWAGAADVNSRSIGIELANPGPLAGYPPFPEAQMVALEALLDAILARWRMPPAHVIAHSDMAPERKVDPGPKFDWRRLGRAGRALWVEGRGGSAPNWDVFCAAASAAGYPETMDRETLLDAFRLRFRPAGRGRPLEPVDTYTAQALADASTHVDRGDVSA